MEMVGNRANKEHNKKIQFWALNSYAWYYSQWSGLKHTFYLFIIVNVQAQQRGVPPFYLYIGIQGQMPHAVPSKK